MYLQRASRSIAAYSKRHLSVVPKEKSCASAIPTPLNENVKPFNTIPGPLRLPFWGNLYLYKVGKYNVSKYHKVLEHLYSKYGPLVREDIGLQTVIHAFDPDDIQTVYNNEDSMPYVVPLQETTQVYRKANDMSPGLGNVNGEQWYRLRSAVRQMMLRPREVHYYLPFVQDIADDFVLHLEKHRDSDGKIRCLRDEVAKWVLESSGMVCFEKRLGCLSGMEAENTAAEMIQANKAIFLLSGLLKFSLPIYRYIQTPKWKRLVQAEDFFYKKAMEYVNQTITQLESVDPRDIINGKFNFMAYLLSKKELSRKDVTIITFSLFADGLTTTVPSLLFNLYCLATNPEVQEKAYKEISSNIKENEEITIDRLNKLSYLKAIVKETFRMYPIGTEVSRIVQKDLVLSGYKIPAGTHVHLTPNVHFRSEKYFLKPSEFKPERWLRGNELTSEIHPFLLTPFGHGPRTCAGRRFAEQDLYVVLCRILQKFQLKHATTSEPMEQVYNTLLFPDGNVQVQFIDRTQCT